MGVLVTSKQPVFKQGGHLSRNLEALGPLFLKELEVIDGYFVGVVS